MSSTQKRMRKKKTLQEINTILKAEVNAFMRVNASKHPQHFKV